jgi:putative chitinase
MNISTYQLQQIMPYSAGQVIVYVDLLNAAMAQFMVNTAKRQAAFLAQVAQESGELRYLEETNGGAQYEGRADLGNVEPGDGALFKGRGLIQITGRTNYTQCGTYLGIDLITDPTQLATPKYASLSAGWFWADNGLNGLADMDKFGTITKLINGGYNGLDNRIAYWLRAREALGVNS